MRNIKTRTKTMKKKLNKCKNIFYAYNDIQYKYGELLEERKDSVEIKCNVKIDFELGKYTLAHLDKVPLLITLLVPSIDKYNYNINDVD